MERGATQAGSGLPADGMMRAMLLDAPGAPLRPARIPLPPVGPRDVLVRVRACGVCRTDLHLRDGELMASAYPRIPGHEVVGEVVALGSPDLPFARGARVGVPWLGATCGVCPFCRAQRENLCDAPVFTGRDRDGGYAEYVAADARFCFALPARYDDAHAAPLLCAGLIGYRAYAMTEGAKRIGLYGFGAAAHLIAQVALWQGREVMAVTRAGDSAAQRFARSLGVQWAGAADAVPHDALDAAILFAPDGGLVPQALRAVKKGGVVVCAGIHMSDIPGFPYAWLWGERVIRSVANLTRADGEAFFALAAEIPLQIRVTPFALDQAEAALDAVRAGRIEGAAVLIL